MTQVSELIEALCLAELQDLHYGEQFRSGLDSESVDKLLSFLNRGLKQLSSRFVLQKKELVIDCVENVSLYKLRREFAVNSGSSEPYKYIQDTTFNPFTGDVIKVLEVYNEVGEEFVLNHEGDPGSLFLTQSDVIQIPYPENGKAFSVIYQTYHPKLTSLTDTVILPPLLEEALVQYAAHKAYQSVNGEGPTAKSAEYKAVYEALCAEADLKDMVGSSHNTSHTKLEMRGWV